VASALKANGQFTVFAPTDAAFAAAGAQFKSLLARQMSYLNVLGKYDAVALLRVINEAGGEAKLRTAQGGVLVARMNGPTNIQVINEKGNTANIAIYDVRDKNGIVHVVDHLIEPAGPPGRAKRPLARQARALPAKLLYADRGRERRDRRWHSRACLPPNR